MGVSVPVSTVATLPKRPYLGLKSFREEDHHSFYGRDKEISELLAQTERHTLTVVYGKSGIGKTSLLRAGLIPAFKREYYLPIYVRINFEDQKNTPLAQVKKIAEEQVTRVEKEYTLGDDVSLWEYFHGFGMVNSLVTPLLILDQFEELFTIGKNNAHEKEALIRELADLIENKVPASVNDRFRADKKVIPRELIEAKKYRVIFSLREDYLPQLDCLKANIPSLKWNQYRILQMQGAQAKNAIVIPAKDIIGTEEAVAIIRKIPASGSIDYFPFETDDAGDSWQRKKIEPFLLSLYCYQLNEARILAGLESITSDLIRQTDVEDLVKNHYENTVNSFTPEKKKTEVSRAIEDLLTSDDYRKLYPVEELKKTYSISDGEVEKLVDSKIVRRERRDAITYIELIHDALIGVVKEQRNKRILEEKLEKRSIEAKQKVKNNRVIAFVSAALCSVIIVFLVIAVSEKREAEIQKRIALQLQHEALQQAEIARRERSSAENSARLAKEQEALALAARDEARVNEALAKSEKQRADLARRNALEEKLKARRAELKTLSLYQELEIQDSINTKKLVDFLDSESDWFGQLTHNEEKNYALMSLLDLKDSNDKKGYQSMRRSFALAVKAREVAGTDADAALQILGKAREINDNAITRTVGDELIRDYLFRTAVFPLNLKKGSTVKIAPGGKLLVASSAGKVNLVDITQRLPRTTVISLYDPADKQMNQELQEASPIYSFAFSAQGDTILGVDNNSIRIWSASGRDLSLLHKFPESGIEIVSTALSPDGKHVLLGGFNGSMQYLDIAGKLKRTVQDPQRDLQDPITAIAFSPGGQYALTGSEDGYVGLYKTGEANSAIWRVLDSDTTLIGVPASIAFSPDGAGAVVGLSKQRAIYWPEINYNKPMQDWPRLVLNTNEPGAVSAVAVSADHKMILTGSAQGKIYLWGEDGKKLKALNGNQDGIASLAFTADGKHVVAATVTGVVTTWNISNQAGIDSLLNDIPPLTYTRRLMYGIVTFEEALSSNRLPDLAEAAAYYNGLNKSGSYAAGDSVKYRERVNRQEKVNALRDKISALNPTAPNKKAQARAYGDMAWYKLFTGEYRDVVTTAQKGLALDPEEDWIYTNLALGLLLDGRYTEAEKIYLAYKDRPFGNAKGLGQQHFKPAFLEDFDVLEKAGLIQPDRPDVLKIKKILK